MDWCTPPTSSLRSTAARCPSTRVIPVFDSKRNPVCSAVTSYFPTLNSDASYRPEESVTSVRIAPVSTFLTLTVAPTMMAPVESVTTPLSEASPCAHAFPGVSARSNKTKPVIDFQATLLVLTRVIESLLIPAKIFSLKNRPQKEKSHRQNASGGGILELLGL